MVICSNGEVLSNSNLPANMDDGLMMNGFSGNLENSLESELELILQQQHSRAVMDRERDLNMYRSGSAPPTVEGSLNAVGSLFRNSNHMGIDNGNSTSFNGVLTEEEIRSHPAYLSYYYSHANFNPRLPPPLLSKEDWRVTHRFQAGASSFEGTRDWLKKNLVHDGGSSSLFSMQPGLGLQNMGDAELGELREAAIAKNVSRQSSAEWMDRNSDNSIGFSATCMGARRKSFADILQEGLDQPASLSGRISRPPSHNMFGDYDARNISNSHSAGFCNGTENSEILRPIPGVPDLTGFQKLNSSVSHSFASAVGSSLSRSRTPEAHLVGRSSSPGLPPVGSRVFPVEKQNIVGNNTANALSSSMTELAEVAASLSGLCISNNHLHDEDANLQSQIQLEFDEHSHLVDVPNGKRLNLQQQLIDTSRPEKLGIGTKYSDYVRHNANIADVNVSKLGFDRQVNFPRRVSSSADFHYSPNTYEVACSKGANIYQADNFAGTEFVGHIPNGYSAQKLKTVVNNNFPAASRGHGNEQLLKRRSNPEMSSLHLPVMDPHYVPHSSISSDYSTHSASASLLGGNSYGISDEHVDLEGLQKVYLEALHAQQTQQYESSFFSRSRSLNLHHYGNHAYGNGIQYQGNLMASSVLHPVESRSLLQNERVKHFSSTLRSSVGGSTGSWNPENGINVEGRCASSLLDELKNNKTKSFELSDVVGHVIEFSTDQYGSRFIQQKLETARVEEKEIIFPEIIPHARSLMTDVFGNYVIQKFFEYGTESQREELASHLIGHVLPLSLQMYGCRVIQKALEVVGVDQQTQMVTELDGSVMKCVRDQNGNHVIQKCIECVPQDRIQFIVSSFFGQVISLSSHPYGCRVIQRVLEHCDDPNTQNIVMEEIMNSVCILAQDQYGNYVIQHVLQHGKPHERSAIISKLAGQIIKMSQQKFASNVVEKCLTFGGPEERQLLVNEMLGTTDENEPLQAMMKDPFGNYVVQKVIETCDDRSRELILSRIKVHLAALKRYTYGKHIVSRVEKLLISGERRSALSSSSSSSSS